MSIKTSVSFTNSIATRYSLFFSISLITTLFLTGYLIDRRARVLIDDNNKSQIVHASNLVHQSFTAMLSEVRNDIALMSQSESVINFINGVSTNNQSIDWAFTEFLKSKPNYFQIRLLDVKANGRELIKFEKKEGQIRKIRLENLQFKGDKTYYQQAVTSTHSYFFSEINLNEEFGLVSLPHIPTLRAIGKLYDQSNELVALMAINVDMTQWFEFIEQIESDHISVFAVDTNGNYKYHKDPDARFDNQTETGRLFHEDFEVIEESREIFEVESDLAAFLGHSKTFGYSDQFHQIRLYVIAHKDYVFSNSKALRQDILIMIALVSIAALVLFISFTSFMSKRFAHMTMAMANIDEDSSEGALSHVKNRKDEFGLLANTFLEMKRKINDQLNSLKLSVAKEKQATNERDTFLQNMSHELRTPLNAILGLCGILANKNDDPKHQPIIQSLQSSAANLSGLMHDILDQHKLLEGKVKLSYQPVNLNALLKDIVATHHFEAVKKSVDIELNIDEHLMKCEIITDQLRLTQILTNLLVNAIKYTQEGQVNIKANLVENKLKIDFIDTGIGISPENLLLIQERFFQASNVHIGAEKGFGLGLSIVKNLVALMQGHLDVISTQGKGSTFSINIPVTVTEIADTQYKNAHTQYPSFLKGKNVLCIEDDQPTATLLTHTLEDLGMNPLIVTNIDHAFQQLGELDIHLIVTDMMLDGHVVNSSELKALNNKCNALIVLSAFDPLDAIGAAYHYFQKPYKPNELNNCITSLIGSNEFPLPILANVYQQYDDNIDRIQHYLKLLCEEFDGYTKRFINLKQDQDLKEWNAIKHKLITHIRSLELSESPLKYLQDEDNIKGKSLDEIIAYCHFLTCWFANELRVISKN
ncbi:MAG: hypothetical protein JXQ90_00665 [Cyclobacteriaceae bacterium]